MVHQFDQYWGKSSGNSGEPPSRFHLLPYHCLDVAAVGQQLLTRDPSLLSQLSRLSSIPKERLLPLLLFFLAIRDVGKFSGRFQGLVPELMLALQGQTTEKPYTIRHDQMALVLFEARIWPAIWSANRFTLDQDDPSVEEFDWQEAWEPWFRAVAGHHGKPVSREGEVADLYSPDDQSAALEFVEAATDLFLSDLPAGSLPFTDKLIPSSARFSFLLAGFVVLCDWIGSSTEYFAPNPVPMPLEEYYHARVLAERQIGRADRSAPGRCLTRYRHR